MNITSTENISNQPTYVHQGERVRRREAVQESFVQEQDFPQKAPRLEGLIATYCGEKNIPALTPTKQPAISFKLTPSVKIKSFESLSSAERQKVLLRIRGIDYTAASDILNFGSTKDGELNKQADMIISKYAAHDFDELTEPMTDLLAILKSSNYTAIVSKFSGKRKPDDSKKWGVVESIREILGMKRAKERMYKLLIQRESIMRNLQELTIEMTRQGLSLLQDIEIYEQMGCATFEQVNELGLDIIALNMLIEDATNKLKQLVGEENVDENGNVIVSGAEETELYQIQKLHGAIDRMQRRKHAILSVRVAAMQTLSMLAAIIKGDELICEKINEVTNMVIPLWSWQYAIAIGALRQQQALSLQKAARGITSKLFTGNARLLHDNMIAAQKELYTATVAVEDLQLVQDYIENMVVTVQAKSKDAGVNMFASMKNLQQVEQRSSEMIP